MAGLPIWYELMTPDPEGSAPFYKAVLEWNLTGLGTATPTGHPYWMIGRSDGGNAGGALLLTDEMQAGGARPGWLPYFHVEDARAAAAKAESLGARTWLPPMDTDHGTMTMLGDPQGAAFYLITPKPPEGEPGAVSDVFKPGAVGHCSWNELSTEDADGQVAFYTELLGWTVDGEMPMPGDHTYRFIACEGQQIGAIGSMKPEGAPSAWLMYFRVADIAAAQTRVEAQGGKVHHGPHEVPGDDVILICTDPAGAAIGLVGAKGA